MTAGSGAPPPGNDVAGEWTRDRILAAAADWVWVPDDATEVRTDDYHLIAYPEWFSSGTQVAWCRSERPADTLVREIAGQVRRWGRDQVSWWLSSASRPADLESWLRTAGAALSETVEVLAYDLTGPLPDVGTVDVRCVPVDDARTLADAHLVAQEVWGGGQPPSEQVERDLAGCALPIAERGEFRVVAYVGNEPAATGGCTLAGGVARLWGAATRPALRGGGAYRAVLLTRLAIARDHGATLGLVKGRVATSGPILRRAGFTAYGRERRYLLPV
ncbi:hypothetical protein ACWDWO_05560 [Actinopolymorpha singaporensis]